MRFKFIRKVKTNCYILSGSNIGNSLNMLFLANQLIEKNIGIINQKSAIYKTAAWGNTAQNDFYNQVLEIETNLNAQDVLNSLLAIENKLGRVRNKKWEARIIDLDILYFGNEIIDEPNLTVPHPYLHQRRFTLEPLVEISPLFIHPKLKKTNLQLLQICSDALKVEKL